MSKSSTSGGGKSSSGSEVMTLQHFAHHADAVVANTAKDALQALPAGYATDEPIQQLLDQLVSRRSTVPDKDPELSQLDRAILPLTELVRKMFVGGPYDISNKNEPAPPSPQSARSAGCMLQDLSEADLLAEASTLLKAKHFSDATGPATWPVHGILYGPCKRPLVCLPTALGTGGFKNIIFLVDTGAPITELSPNAFDALGAEAVPNAAQANLNGRRCYVRLCAQDGNHPDIPVLGADYMTKLQLSLLVNYKDDTMTLDVAP